MRELYKSIPNLVTIDDVSNWIRQATRERAIDVEDYQDQIAHNTYIYDTAPTSETDTIGTEKPGDISTDSSYLYVAVDDSGTKWKPVILLTDFITLVLKAGTASYPPLKFTEGTLNTTPQQGAVEFSDGHLYFSKEDNVRTALALSNNVKTSTTTIQNTTTETTIFSKAFAANELHADQVVSADVFGSVTNASASDDFTIRFKLNGTTIHTITRAGGNVTDAGYECRFIFTVRSVGATGEIFDFFSYTESGSSYYAEAEGTGHTIDTTTTDTFSITIQWDNAKAGNVLTCTQGFITYFH